MNINDERQCLMNIVLYIITHCKNNNKMFNDRIFEIIDNFTKDDFISLKESLIYTLNTFYSDRIEVEKFDILKVNEKELIFEIGFNYFNGSGIVKTRRYLAKKYIVKRFSEVEKFIFVDIPQFKSSEISLV